MSKYPGPVAARATCRRPLAAAIATVFALVAPAASATTYVTNCNDAGVGSLRGAVTVAVEGDIVDASGLTTASPGCSASKITLTTGDIVASRNNLTIQGPGLTALNVTGKYGTFPSATTEHYRIFTHTGTGTLTIKDLTVSKGYLISAAGIAQGGCIYSKGKLSLQNVGVYWCSANTISGGASGGGIYSMGNLSLASSTISQNITNGGGSGGFSLGGGAATLGDFVSNYSSIVGNRATNTADDYGRGGGVFVRGPNASISNSIIARNTAASKAGGLETYSRGQLTIINSTISGNSAKGFVGGISSRGSSVFVGNSTIAFNTAGFGTATKAAGWDLGAFGVITATFQSTLVANNRYGSAAIASDISGNIAITGSKNLVRAPSISLPSDTIIGQCPLLGSLRDNGGPTLTHALLSHSPAIDSGNNILGELYDQRGPPHARISGSATDIGAYEVDQADKVFDTDFEGCT